MNATSERGDKWPFWGYLDVAVFVLVALPSILAAVFIGRALDRLVRLGTAFNELLVQLIWYVIIFGVLYLLLRTRYHAAFWRSLGWAPPYRRANWAFFGGPVLAIVLGYLGYVIHAPNIPMPFRQMFANRPTIVLFAVFAVILGPLCEELAFRGFLMPLLVRTFGAIAGVLITAGLFAGMHAPEYDYSWKHLVLIGAAGAVFGWVRYRTRSTAASTFMHSSFNLTQLVAFLAQARVHD